MKSYQKEVNKKTKNINVVFGSIAITLLITATYLTFTQHHFAVAINTWQAKFMGDNKYFPALTIFLLALPPLLILLFIKSLLLQWMRK